MASALTGNWSRDDLIWECGGSDGAARVYLNLKLTRCDHPATFWFNAVSPRCPSWRKAARFVDAPLINELADGSVGCPPPCKR